MFQLLIIHCNTVVEIESNNMLSDLSFDIVMITLLSISIKFSSQYNEILGYKWNSVCRVIRNSWKSTSIESMAKFCTVFK